MRKEDKAIIIEKLGEKLKEYAHFYLVDVTGLNAETTSALRRKCFKSEIKMVVVKNNLLHKALEQSETDFTPLYDSLKGTTAVFFCNTANVPAKLIKEEGKATGIPALKAAYAEEERGYRRSCGFAAISSEECYLSSPVWFTDYSRCA